MDALLTAFLACLLVETGDKGQLLSLALAVRFRRIAPLIAGVAVAAAANAVISALAGDLLAPLLSADARALFLALALLFAGIGMLFPAGRPDLLSGWRIGAFATATLGLSILAFGNGAQFLTLAIATRTADPVLTACGAGLGTIAAWLPVMVLRQRFFTVLPLRRIRRGGGVILTGIGLIVGLGAIGLL
jgi:putative Ca2+/H+ antiporter (TMEM165/GDT1 family)